MNTQIDNGEWHVDRARSRVSFRVRHFGVATVRGHFESFDAQVDAGDEGLQVEGRVDAASVETGHGIRDSRLRSEFFDADHHPAIVLRATTTGDGRRLRGQLTIRGATRPVDLEMRVAAIDGDAIRVRAGATIRRSDFGLEWDALRDAGRLLVADEVRLQADVVLTR